MNPEIYDDLAAAVAAAGFFTNGFMNHGTWHRTCVASKKRAKGGLTGNSFWVSRLASGWYLGTWGPYLYRIPDESRLAELCIRWLTRVPNELLPDFDAELKRQFGLVPVPLDVFELEIGQSL